MVTGSLFGRRRLKCQANRVPGLVVAGLAAALSVVTVATAACSGVSASTRGWHSTYLDPAGDDPLTIVALAGNDAWATGGKLVAVAGPQGGPVYAPVLLRWNGRSWAAVRTPRPVPEGGAEFITVAASSTKNVWAFGTEAEPQANNGPYPARWNGSRWQWLTQPPVLPNGEADAAAVLGRSDVWISDVGFLSLAHWNGQSWRLNTQLGPGPPHWNGKSRLNTQLEPIQYIRQFAPVSSRNIWALASADLNDPSSGPWGVVHWNGSTWRHSPLPGKPSFRGNDIPVIAFSGNDNGYVLGGDASRKVYRWDGHSWHTLAVPLAMYRGLRVKGTSFSAVIPDTTGGFWAALSAVNESGAFKTYRLVHYSRGRWTAVALPPIRNRAGQLQMPFVNDLAEVPGSSQFWATLDYAPDQNTLVEHIYAYQP